MRIDVPSSMSMLIEGTTTMVCSSSFIVSIECHSGTSFCCSASKRASTSAGIGAEGNGSTADDRAWHPTVAPVAEAAS